MKKNILYLFLIIAVVAFSSCKNEIDDVFSESAAQRVQDAIDKDFSVLTSASNGWIMEYYGNPGANNYGGYVVLCDFDESNHVTVASELAGTSRETSHFKLEQSAGVVLSFDDYNSIFHYFSDPNSGLGTKGYGFYGDLEFRVISACADSVIMSGKKHNAKIVMTPMPVGMDWQDYLDDIAAKEEAMSYNSFNLYMGSEDTLSVSPTYHSMIFEYDTLQYVSDTSIVDGVEVVKDTVMVVPVQEVHPYVMTAQGMKFYKPFTYNNHTVTGFSCPDGADMFPAFDDASIILDPLAPPINQQFIDNAWFMSYETQGDYAKPYWDNVKAILDKETPKGVLYWCYFGKFNTKFGLRFLIGSYTGELYYTYKLSGDDKITLTFNGESTKGWNADGRYSYKSEGFKNIVNNIFGGTKGKTFKIETDNLKRPTYVKLTETDDPTHSMTLSAEAVYYPLGAEE